ncbi:MAG: hypothetical protein M0020_05770 [Actinomycetota bacterium]|nr:hypothetical protein [Actinomycetota bacterium]
MRCHRLDLPLWRDLGLDELRDPLAARLGRNTFFLGRLRATARPVTLGPDAVAGLHASQVAAFQLAPGRAEVVAQ